MKKRYYKIDVNGHGGENVMGFVNNEKDIELLRKLAEDEEVGWNNEDEESGHYVDGYEIDDMFHVFGGEVNDVTLDVSEIEKPEDYVPGEWFDVDEVKEIRTIEEYMSNDDSIKFCARNPFIRSYEEAKERHNLSDEALIYGAYTVEKSFWSSYVIETEGEFDIKNLVFGICSMDETLTMDEIIDNAYYITPDQFKEYMETKGNDESLSDDVRGVYKEFLNEFNEGVEEGEYTPHELMSDYIGEMIDKLKEVTNIINKDTNPYDGEMYDPLPEFRLEELGDCDGRGKSQSATLMDIKGNVLQELH